MHWESIYIKSKANFMLSCQTSFQAKIVSIYTEETTSKDVK